MATGAPMIQMKPQHGQLATRAERPVPRNVATGFMHWRQHKPVWRGVGWSSETMGVWGDIDRFELQFMNLQETRSRAASAASCPRFSPRGQPKGFGAATGTAGEGGSAQPSPAGVRSTAFRRS